MTGTERFGLRFHHFGLAVAEPEPALRFLAGLGYAPGPRVFDPLQNVHLVLCTHPAMPAVEAIWPANEASPVQRLIRRGHMIYHLCYVSADAARSLAAIEAAGLATVPLGPAQPAVLFGGTPVSFHSVDGFGMIELIHGEPA